MTKPNCNFWTRSRSMPQPVGRCGLFAAPAVLSRQQKGRSREAREIFRQCARAAAQAQHGLDRQDADRRKLHQERAQAHVRTAAACVTPTHEPAPDPRGRPVLLILAGQRRPSFPASLNCETAMTSPYAIAGPALIARGYSAIPIMPGEKRPDPSLGSEWERFCDRLPTDIEIDVWSKRPLGVGVALGAASGGLVAIDIDSDDLDVTEAIELRWPSTVRKAGRKGYTAFYWAKSRDQVAGVQVRQWRRRRSSLPRSADDSSAKHPPGHRSALSMADRRHARACHRRQPAEASRRHSGATRRGACAVRL